MRQGKWNPTKCAQFQGFHRLWLQCFNLFMNMLRKARTFFITNHVATTLIGVVWMRFGSAITSISWMTVGIALSPRFADLSLINISWMVIVWHGLENDSIERGITMPDLNLLQEN